MCASQSCSKDIPGRISLISAIIPVVAAFSVVMLPMLVPAWIAWTVTLGSGLFAVFGAILRSGVKVASLTVPGMSV